MTCLDPAFRMNAPVIWYFVKFFKEERYADMFMAGDLHLNTLAYFRQAEIEDGDGRKDSTEGVAMWWQPGDFVMNLSVPGIGDVTITKADLAGPVSMAFQAHDNLHLLCLYAVHTTGFECIDGKIDFAPEQEEELQRQLRIDERCMRFGRFAVVTPAVPFLDQLRDALKKQGLMAKGKLVEYYDDATFHGEIPVNEVPFRKQKRFSFQREFRLCVYPRTKEEAADDNPVTIKVGDLSHICGKVEAATLARAFELKTEPAPFRDSKPT